MYVFCSKVTGESHGSHATSDSYSPIHLKYKNTPLTYRFLKQKRIHNLEYYDLVCKGLTIYDNTYLLKKDFLLYKAGVTGETHKAICIKI